MKKVTVALGAFLALFFISCNNDGIDGQDGIDGSIFEATAFEIEVDMVLNTDLNRFEFAAEPFPDDIPLLLVDDVVLMFRLEEMVDDLEVWRQLPQPFFSDSGLLFYNFDFTLNDYGIFVEPEFDAALTPSELVSGQVFRIVVIPGNLGASKLDRTDLSAVLSSLGIEEKDIKRIQL